VVLDIEGLQEPQFDDRIFDNLVLPKRIKDTLQTLASHNNRTEGVAGRSFTADFIRGKGEGQVWLLHGNPGVGKTCAAGERSGPTGHVDLTG
jgi:hypothetical protein